ncbi:response regulator transcription factor [Natronospora cellulosivora (SeqCode)]
MYNLLIIDDEVHAVDGIKSSVNWEDLKIGGVFTAYNIQQAKDIIGKNRIDIILCDIEMPQGSGLELLKWVRQEYTDIKCIFLTCHAEFNYTRQAIQLGSLDYILKPASSEELTIAIHKAISEIKKESSLKERSRLWDEHKSIFVERFWQDIVMQKIAPDFQSIKKAAELQNIPLQESDRYLPIIINIQGWHKDYSLHDKKLMEFELQRVAIDIFCQSNNSQILQLYKDEFIIILLDNGYLDKINIIKKCKQFIETNKNECDLLCYIGDKVFVNNLATTVHKLHEYERNNIAFKKRVFLLSEYKKPESKIETVNIELWTTLINEGLKERLINEVQNFLENMASATGLNSYILYQFQQNFLQIIYSILKQKGIKVHQIIDDERIINIYENAQRSIDDMLIWVEYIVKSVENYSQKQENETSVEKSIKYIHQNLEKQITRDDIAEYVGYNSDYLNRIFKEETGYSMVKYLLIERIEMAKELLSKTNMQISTIAVHVGYNNFSHFAKMYKKLTGMSPSEYRDNHKRKDNGV